MSSHGDLPVTRSLWEGAGGARLTAYPPGGTGWRLGSDSGWECRELIAEEGPAMGRLGAQTALSAFLPLLWTEAC